MYKAHINEQTGAIQTVKEHCENTAQISSSFSVPKLKELVYAIGILHDIGKYQDSFQRRISGDNVRVEHSICGAIEAFKTFKGAAKYLAAYCIAGHHAGIPDGGSSMDSADMSTLGGRLRRPTEDYSIFRDELVIPQIDETEVAMYLLEDCENSADLLTDKFAFMTRYCFSCLVDADSLDTAKFCEGTENRHMSADFAMCLDQVNNRLQAFRCDTELQKNRVVLQQQVFEKADKDAEIFLMNMPTGSGKTLCSVKFALQRAISGKKKRIIYVIPYNSIIDQTADTFDAIFDGSAEILRHQSTFSYDDTEYDEDYRKLTRFSSENWDADFIITTSVQFFESVYANKRSKLRKLHNMGDSILIFDEAHLMPLKYLQPCLEAVSFITRYLGSEAFFLTATMPDFRKLLTKYTFKDCRITDLIEDKTAFSVFQKCKYQDLGVQTPESVLIKAEESPSSLIIVNKRSTARQFHALCDKRKKYHLSTYMAACDRKRVIDEIRCELARLEEDFPGLTQVPEERRIIVVSTSLIEAGVDLDFHTVFRELTGLDSILQAGGRCNREGHRSSGDVFIFSIPENRPSANERANLTKGLMSEFEDISCGECIKAYYDRLFLIHEEDLSDKALHRYAQSIRSIPFRKYADDFGLIDSDTVSLVVGRDETSIEMIENLRITGSGSEREFQKYTCTLYRYELDQLVKQHAADDFGSGIWCLTNSDYYDEDIGVCFEASDYYIE